MDIRISTATAATVSTSTCGFDPSHRRARPWPRLVAAVLMMVAIGGMRIAAATTIAVPNGDFSNAANNGSVGGGLLGASGTNVAIGSGPWTGSYHGALGLLAPPTLTINSTLQTARISGLVGISALGIVTNGGYFSQVLGSTWQPNTLYSVGVDIDAGATLQLALLDSTHTGVALVSAGTVLASSDTAAAGLVTLLPLQNTRYRLTLNYTTPASVPAAPIEVRLFSLPQGVLTANLLPSVTFGNAALDGVALGTPVGVDGATGGGQSAVVAQAFANPVGLRVINGVGAGVAGVQVTFASPASGPGAVFSDGTNTASTLTVLTDASGRASVAASANTIAGSYVFSVQVAGLHSPTSFALTNVAGPASVVSIVGGVGSGSQSATVGTAFADPLAVAVGDAFGNPVAGVIVTYTANAAANGSSAALVPTSVISALDGHAAIAATANTIAGAYSVSAQVAGVVTAATFQLTNLAGAQAAVVASGGTLQSTIVGTAFANPLVVHVVDAFNNPVAGVSVAFSAGAAANGASAVLAAPSAVTAADGSAAVTAMANTVAGAYAVSASVAGVGVPATFALGNVPASVASLLVSGGGTQSARVHTAFALPLLVTALDAFGNAVPNVLIGFTAPAQNGASATLSASSASTGASGQASVIATANAHAGSYAVAASVAGASIGSFALTNTAGLPNALSLVGGSTQSTTVDTAFAIPLTVGVVDLDGNPVGGILVSFAAPDPSGASAVLSSASATTGTDGHAVISATANTIAGSYAVGASVAGVVGLADFALTNLAGLPHDIVPVDAGGGGGATTQSAMVNTAFAQPMKVRIVDAFANAVSGVGVQFVAPGAGASAVLHSGSQSGATLNLLTDLTGAAVVTATANSLAGSYNVVASVGGVSTPVTYRLTNVANDVASTIGGGGQTTAVETEFACALIVQLVDPAGQPRASVPVVFSAPAQDASALLTDGVLKGAASITVNTDLDGVAWVEATANAIVGRYAVTAQEQGTGSQVVGFNLVNLAAGDPLFGDGFDPPCAVATRNPAAGKPVSK